MKPVGKVYSPEEKRRLLERVGDGNRNRGRDDWLAASGSQYLFAGLLAGCLAALTGRTFRAYLADHGTGSRGLPEAGWQREWGFNDKAHFLSVALRVMRQVLVDHARARATKKRAGDEHGKLVPLNTGIHLESNTATAAVELLDLDAALEALAGEDRSLAQLIEMRYFGGMTAEETAEAVGQSVHIVRHDLRLPKPG